ncbi:MAG: NPCBM/NEW2 domain-containing protein [Planctomycetes bacterium]|nr:NPCBM/NEW2 domain-containing protein [Planctomycetota bacterium]
MHAILPSDSSDPSDPTDPADPAASRPRPRGAFRLILAAGVLSACAALGSRTAFAQAEITVEEGDAVKVASLSADGEPLTLRGQPIDPAGQPCSWRLEEVTAILYQRPAPAQPASPPDAAAGEVEVLMRTGDLLRGRVAAASDRALPLALPGGGPTVEIPFPRLARLQAAVGASASAPGGAPGAGADRGEPAPGADPVVTFALAGGGEETVTGELVSVDPERVVVDMYGTETPLALRPGGPRTLRLMRFPNGPQPPRRPPALSARFALAGGGAISGQPLGLAGGVWSLRHVDLGLLRLPEATVLGVSVESDRRRFLSDLAPLAVDEGPGLAPLEGTGFNPFPLTRDADVLGARLRLGGREHPRGLGVHARSRLAFAPGDADLFLATVGLTDAAGRLGSVIFRVYIEGKAAPAFDSGVMRAGDPPRPVRVEVGGAARVILEVTDAGDGPRQDRAAWAGARFVRKS